MKMKVRPTGVERVMREDDFIVSKTNPKGIITYCNEIFMEFAQLPEEELVGKQHNVIRHPDMPRAVFRLLWQTLQDGREFNGFIKNLSADGGHYWVFANVTPSKDVEGRLLGYYSVRRKPSQAGIRWFETLYARMLEAEQAAGAAAAISASTPLLMQALDEVKRGYNEQVYALQFG